MATNINYQTSEINLTTAGAKFYVPADATTNTGEANRLYFQSGTADTYTVVSLIPNGTSTSTYMNIYGSSDLANNSVVTVFNTGPEVGFNSTKLGTGSVQKLKMGRGIFSGGSVTCPQICLGTNNKVGINIQDQTTYGNSNYALNICTGANLPAAVGNTQYALRLFSGVDNGTTYSVNQDGRGRMIFRTYRNTTSGGGDEWPKQAWQFAHMVDSTIIGFITFFYDTGGTMFIGNNNPSATNAAFQFYSNNTSYANSGIVSYITRANSTVWYSFMTYSSDGADAEFYARGDGNVFAEGAFTGGGADYAELFEWEDQNPTDEDRRGISVVLTQDGFIRPATEQDNSNLIVGVISAASAVRGNEPLKWKDKYLRDDYGAYIRDQDGHKILNPEFDSEQEYVKRSDRKEWDAVGLVGKLHIRKQQPLGSRWILLKTGAGTDPDLYLVR